VKLSPALLRNRLGADRVVTLDQGIFTGLRAAAIDKKVSFSDLLAITIALALGDGSDLPSVASIAEECRISPDMARLCIQILREEGWLTGTQTADGKKLWLLKRREDPAQPLAEPKGATLPTRLDELVNAWMAVTDRPISPQLKNAAFREMAEGKLLGSPKHSDLVAEFFHHLRPRAGFMELVQELGMDPEPLVEVALRWSAAGKPNLADLTPRAAACHGLWLLAKRSGRSHQDFYRILGGVILGVNPQVFKSFCKSRYTLSDAIDMALRRKAAPLPELDAPIEDDNCSTWERFMKTPITL
jgi:hypothetical protein